MARAKEDRLGADVRGAQVLPVLVHGDAAFAGQGVVAETLNLSEVEGYDVGGTVHVVVDNQLGFTTAPESGRSSVYATDVAKMVQAPIFHVNGDDPEACVRVIRLAFEFRQAFHKDVVVDLVCYRRYGHNEGDEPAFTQPADVRADRGAPVGAQALHRAARQPGRPHDRRVRSGPRRLPGAPRPGLRRDARPPRRRVGSSSGALDTGEPDPGVDPAVTAVAPPVLDRSRGVTRRADPTGSPPTRSSSASSRPSATRFAAGTGRLGARRVARLRVAAARGHAGAARRPGHAARHVQPAPRRHRRSVRRQRSTYRCAPRRRTGAVTSSTTRCCPSTPRSGSSTATPSPTDRRWSCWEAQFGDFANGAQIIIDQFIVAAADKWGQRSSLALLLPHGFEGQGPEHSSARIERFLALCADENLRVVYPSTAAQYFHVLRRQARSGWQIPLVCFTPKRYLRMEQSRSPIDDLDGRRLPPRPRRPVKARAGDGRARRAVLRESSGTS